MDRKLVLDAQLAIAHGHRLDVVEHIDDGTGEALVLAVTDLDTGVRYRRAQDPRGEVLRWSGRVRDCTVMIGGVGSRTVLTVDTDDDDAAAGARGARIALDGADAAVEAAKAEADRWGGPGVPEPETDRFW